MIKYIIYVYMYVFWKLEENIGFPARVPGQDEPPDMCAGIWILPSHNSSKDS